MAKKQKRSKSKKQKKSKCASTRKTLGKVALKRIKVSTLLKSTKGKKIFMIRK